MASEDTVYHPKDAISAAIKTTMITGTAGAAVSAIQNSLSKSSVSAWGFLTHSGGTIAVFAAMGGSYEFARTASANLRRKEDSLNNAIGGFFGGAALGLRFRTFPAVLGYGAGLAVLMGVFDYTGGKLSGYMKDPAQDEFERKEELRRNRRRPLEETIAELGEGRGIHAPGYAERRRERLREKYGIEVP
ncbi:NADH-ubiquinone oxidoreductase [Xylona heveae TC161]|uniref:NADH-ubiquinone oxidoreductase n=1 Tax=Xylona heveae (strain CBS 132557 / TC161) TaxID=1328760 RepID=A0A165I8Q8_XYLHT|nr:NADH-ubiquinone oxidoreductase [Xylona heveae TC161]KZF24549.1 NADH-ubiquinone oxidoreductase [Xylona heveae TC161]